MAQKKGLDKSDFLSILYGRGVGYRLDYNESCVSGPAHQGISRKNIRTSGSDETDMLII